MAEITRVGWGGFGFLNVPFTISYLAAGFLFIGNYRCSPGIGLSKFSRNRDLRQMVRFRIAASASIGTSWKKQPDDEENSRKMMKRIWEWVHGWTESKEDVSIEFRHFSKIFKNWERTSFPISPNENEVGFFDKKCFESHFFRSIDYSSNIFWPYWPNYNINILPILT